MAKKFLTPIQSTVSTGTAPFIVASTTAVTNLNADLLDGQQGSYYAAASSLSNYQPIDADLTAIAALSGTSGLLKKTAANTWSLDTSSYLTGNQTITLSGDVSGSGTTSISVTVADDSHNHIISNVDGLQTVLDAKAPLASPALTGTPTAPTASAATNNTQIATTAYVKSQGYSTTTGTVTSVAITVPTGLSVSGSPITSSGTLAVSLASGYEIPQSSAIVHIAGTETITGSKTFSTNTYFDGFVSSNELRNRTGQQLILNAGESANYATGQTGEQVYVNAEGGLQVNSSPDNWGTSWAGRYTATICNSSGDSYFPNNVSVTGTLTATSKSFDIDHPTKENMRLRYGSLEGPENGVYVRGKSSSSIITLPDYWTGLVDEDSITVQVTPIGKHRNLYVKDISDNTVTIGGVKRGTEFFYFIQAERKDIDKLVVEYGS